MVNKEKKVEPLVSVVVPTFNSIKKLDRLIDSIEMQKYDKYEVIFVDDGSSDGTCDYLRGRFKKNNKVHIYEKDHAGPGPARCYGFQKSKGKYLMFIDCDDWFCSESSLSEINDIMSGNDVDVCLICRECYPSGEIRNPFNTQPEGMPLKTGVYDVSILKGRQIRGTMSAKLFKREKLHENMFVGAFNYEDMITSLVYLDSCQKIAYREKPIQVCNIDRNRGSLTQTKGYEMNTIMERASNIIKAGKIIHSEPLRISLGNLAFNTYCRLLRKRTTLKKDKSIIIQLEKIICDVDLSSFYYSYSFKRRVFLRLMRIKGRVMR